MTSRRLGGRQPTAAVRSGPGRIPARVVRLTGMTGWATKRLGEGTETIRPDILEGMRRGMREMEAKYGGAENLVVEDAFEWGMINGKLSALRWVLGEDWDELYT